MSEEDGFITQRTVTAAGSTEDSKCCFIDRAQRNVVFVEVTSGYLRLNY